MSPEQKEANAIALRRILGAKATAASALDLSRLHFLRQVPQELEQLTSLQTLDLSGCEQLSGKLSSLAGLTSLRTLNLSGCERLSGKLSSLAELTSLRTLNLSGCKRLDGDLGWLEKLTSLQTLDLSWCKQLSGDLSSVAKLTSLQTLALTYCEQFRRFAPLESLLSTLEKLSLFGCKFEDLPRKVCGESVYDDDVLDKVRAHYKDLKPSKRPDAEVKVVPGGPPTCGLNVFVSYAWGDTSANASEEDRQRQEVVERLCQTLEKEHWQVVRDKTALQYGDKISTFMKTLGQANLVIVVLSAKYLRSPYCMKELHAIYQNSRQEKREFLDRIIPLVLDDARCGTPRERVECAKYWEAEYLKLKADLDYVAEDDFRLYQNMKKWYLDVGDMLAYVNDVLHPRGFENIEKDDFAALRQMLPQRR